MKIEFDDKKLERFIPIRFKELRENLEKEKILSEDKMKQLLLKLQESIHNSLHSKLIQTKEMYHPFNPDSDTISIKKYAKNELQDDEKSFNSSMHEILNSANYEELSKEALHNSINAKSPYGVEVSIDFEYFEYVTLYFRGSAIKTQKLRTLKSLYLKKEETKTMIYKRVLILFKPKDSSDEIFIKLFKNIPSNDLDMLFPNTEVKMTLFDKTKLIVTGGGGTIGGGVTLMGKMAILLEPIALLTAVGAFAGILFRQVKSVFNHRVKYMAKLSKNLYFYNLGNNAGVISYLSEVAEDEEMKEAFLAYIFLAKSATALEMDELDKNIEEYIHKTYNVPINFEIEDALLKLVQFELVAKNGSKFKAI